MAISLEELKRQREQIQKHLEWLDAKIAELAPNEAEAPKAEVTAEVLPSLPEGAELFTPPTPDESVEVATEELKPSIPMVEPDPGAPTYKAKTQSEVMRAKAGCFVLFILGTALFLFLLFGLPYLL